MPIHTRMLTERQALRERRVVLRHRLIAAIDRSPARIRLVVAAPGYGKTTLLEQWAALDRAPVVWYRSSVASSDVAALAAGIAATSESVVPGCARRLRERLSATPDPVVDAVILAEILAEDLAEWPVDAWLVVDDYQRIGPASASERFLATLLELAPVNVILAGRERPAWVSTRAILYGEVFELGAASLSLSDEEAEEILEGWPPEQAAGLIALANGWPAVIALAAMTGLPDHGDEEGELPATLYDFFAEEVFQRLAAGVRAALSLLAWLPPLDRELVAGVLGDETASEVLSGTLASGLIEERDGRFELHPLARAYVVERGPAVPADELHAGAATCLRVFRARRDWDAFFDVARRHSLADELVAALADALGELLAGARLETIDDLLAWAEDESVEALVLQLARAEVGVRRGQSALALTVARAALEKCGPADPLRYPLLMVAGRAAHIAVREEEALELYRLAEDAAAGDAERRQAAVLGQAICCSALEMEQAQILARELQSEIRESDPQSITRVIELGAVTRSQAGSISGLDELRRVADLVAYVDDPVARCGFRSTYSSLLVMAADYEAASGQASALIAEAEEFRIDFALPYGWANAGLAAAGARRFEESRECLASADRLARQCFDEYAIQNTFAARVRSLIHEGAPEAACIIEPPGLARAIPGIRGEVLAVRGLALAMIGRLDEASRLARQAEQASRGVEARVLVPAIEAVVAVRSRVPTAMESVEMLVAEAFDSGAVDFLVAVFRGAEDVLDAALASRRTCERAVFALARAGDPCSVLGREPAAVLDPRHSLSPREIEVYDLLCQGLKNREIAALLFISDSTVKVHAQHIYEKLGVRSRRALAIHAARERSSYATRDSGSAAGEVSSEKKRNSDPVADL